MIITIYSMAGLDGGRRLLVLAWFFCPVAGMSCKVLEAIWEKICARMQ